MATDLHGGLVQRQPPPRRVHICRFRLGFSPHTPAPEPTTELFSPAPVHRSHPFFLHIKPEPANKIRNLSYLHYLQIERMAGYIVSPKPLELQNFPWVRRNTHVECVRRIELPPSDWKSEVLPLNYTHMFPIAKLPSLEHRNL